jgi:hypothetical protein
MQVHYFFPEHTSSLFNIFCYHIYLHFFQNIEPLVFYSQGTAPTISIDNTSGCQLYLSKDSLGASITSAKSSEMNVMVPSGATDGDWVRSALLISTFG